MACQTGSMRAHVAIDPALHLDPNCGTPLAAQLVDGLRAAIEQGHLHARDVLNSSRSLATELGVARGTVVSAYDQLVAEGYLHTHPGSGTVVAEVAIHHPAGTRIPTPAGRRPLAGSAAGLQRSSVDLRPGTPDVSSVDSSAWRTAWRQAAHDPRPLGDARGLAALRREVSEHLRTMRSLVRPADQLIVTAGAREGLTLLLTALMARNAAAHSQPPVIGVEEPGHPALRGVPGALGLAMVPLRADAQGLVTSELPSGANAPDVVLVTPGHQFPEGGSLSITRRTELLAWAQRTGTLIVEDDYDSELRYVGMPLPTLAALDDPDDGHVVLLGTFSTVLTPALATGYLCPPAALHGLIVGQRKALGSPVPALTQRALAGYLASGELRRHIGRMRREYRRRRHSIMTAFASAGPSAHLAPMTGGLQAVVYTREPGENIVARLAEQGIRVGALSGFWGPGGADMLGIVFGFGAVSTETLQHTLGRIILACDCGNVGSQNEPGGSPMQHSLVE